MDLLPEDANRTLAEKLFAAVRLENADDAEKYLCLGADPDYIMLNGHSSFHIAAGCQRSVRFINLMLKYDGNPNVRNAEGLTPLHIATSWGKINSMKLLIQNGADIHLQDEEGRDLRAFAELHGSPDCVEYAENLLMSANLSNTPKLTKLRVAATHGFEASKENKNPNSPFKKHEIFNIRSPLNEACDDSWIVKRRGSLRKHRKNATSTCSPRTVIDDVNSMRGLSCRKGDKQPAGYTTAENMIYEDQSQVPIGVCYSPVSFRRVAQSPCMESDLIEQMSLHDRLHGDLDTTDKCVGTSILQEASILTKQSNFNMTDKCIGTSVLKILPQQWDHDNVQPKKTINSLTNERCNPGLCGSDTIAASEKMFWANEALNGSKSPPTAMKDCQIPSPKRNGRLKALSPCHTIPFEFDSTQTLPIPFDEISNAVENESDDPSLDARNMLLSTKVPLTKTDVAEFFCDNKKVTDSPQSPGHGTLSLMKFSKPSQANSPSTSKLWFPQDVSLSKDQSQRDKVQRPTNTFEVPTNPDLKHVDIISCLHPGGESRQNCSCTQFDTSERLSLGEVCPSSPDKIISENPCTHMSPLPNIPLAKNLTGLSIPGHTSSSSTPCEEAQSSINIRQFASMSISECVAPSVTSDPSILSRDRLHSTVLLQSSTRTDLAEDISWDISVIKADSPYTSHSMETQPPDQAAYGSTLVKSTEPNSQTITGNSSADATIIYNWKSYWEGQAIPESVKSKRKKRRTPDKKGNVKSTDFNAVIPDLDKLTNSEIREKLVALGVTPGPILACRQIYLKKLKSLLSAQEQGIVQKSDVSNQRDSGEPKFSTELEKHVRGNPLPDSVMDDDDIVRQQFEQPDSNISWREGTAKSSFTYLLLDPRVTNELPIRAKHLTQVETLRSFVGAIFYIGKGKESRPFHHFSEALQVKLKPSHKVQHIRSIWSAGLGVVALHVYQNTIACEAYTREAAMIDAVGLTHLTNCKRGEYYGEAARWVLRRKREYGSFLLEKALKVLMVEGERQIKPSNLESRKRRKCNNPANPVSA